MVTHGAEEVKNLRTQMPFPYHFLHGTLLRRWKMRRATIKHSLDLGGIFLRLEINAFIQIHKDVE